MEGGVRASQQITPGHGAQPEGACVEGEQRQKQFRGNKDVDDGVEESGSIDQAGPGQDESRRGR